MGKLPEVISVIIPTYNEAEIIETSFRTLKENLSALQVPFEVLVVDNGSLDQTCDIVERLSTDEPTIKLIRLPERGPGLAFVAGVRAAKYNHIISLDADLSSDLIFIRYANELLRFTPVVIGSKTFGHQKRSLVRILGSQFFILLTQMVFKLTVTDFSLGSKAYRRADILPLLDGLDPWTGYVLEIVLKIEKEGKKIVQIGIDCIDTRKGRFNLFYEARYRFKHLFMLWLRSKK